MNKKSNSTLVDTWEILGRFCTKELFLYKPGLLTWLVFFAFYPLFCIHFAKKNNFKVQKVTPKVNKRQKAPYSQRGKVVMKALKSAPNDIKK
jgi:hypothetical protein